MENYLSNLMIGIISGIVTSIIIWGFILIYRKIILPGIKEILYKGIEIEGEWHGIVTRDNKTMKDGKPFVEKEKIKEITLSLKQNAYQLDGDLIIKNIDSTGEYFSFYKFSGFIRDNYVVLNYLPKSKKSIGLGTYIFIVQDGGNALNGNLIATEINKMALVAVEGISLTRK
jgi:hypothetical protein